MNTLNDMLKIVSMVCITMVTGCFCKVLLNADATLDSFKETCDRTKEVLNNPNIKASIDGINSLVGRINNNENSIIYNLMS